MTDINDFLFTPDHEWIKVGKDGKAVVGLSDFGQNFLSEVTHIDLPEPDEHEYEAGEEMGVIESLHDSIPFHCPVSGVVTAANSELLSSPELINEDPFGQGWIFEMEIKDSSELPDLMNADEYDHHLPDDEDE